jgi:nitroreductase
MRLQCDKKGSELETILEAGMFAPSSSGKQAWHFTALQTIKDAIKKKVTHSVMGNTDFKRANQLLQERLLSGSN